MPDPPETGATRPDPEARAGARRIVITGFMCAGKTTVGRELARRLSLPFLDLDDLVTEREGRTPAELIDERGEAAFRDAETRALRSALGAGAEVGVFDDWLVFRARGPFGDARAALAGARDALVAAREASRSRGYPFRADVRAGLTTVCTALAELGEECSTRVLATASRRER